MANSVDPDQMPHSVASDPGLHCLLRPVPVLSDITLFEINTVNSRAPIKFYYIIIKMYK